MKKTLLYSLCSLALAAFALPAWGQYQIKNGDFEDWTYDGANLPNNWNSFQTADGSFATTGYNLSNRQVARAAGHAGNNSSHSVVIWARAIVGIASAQGNLTTGRIHAGSMTAADAGNHNYSDRDGSNSNNGVSNPCAMTFKGKPDSVSVWVKYVQAEKADLGEYTKAKFSCIVHDDYDYIKYGLPEKDTEENKKHVVAEAEKEFEECEWTRFVVPFSYTDNEDVKYVMFNASSNAYPGKASFVTIGKLTNKKTTKADSLYVDDIVLIYNSSLDIDKTTYKGSKLQFSEGKAAVNDTYSESDLNLVSDGKGATIVKSYDAESAILNVTVKGNDISENTGNFHAYTIQFEKPIAIVSTKNYNEDLVVSINDEKSTQKANVLVETLENGNINFVLKNFVLSAMELHVGNISIPNIPVVDGKFNFEGNITIQKGDDANVTWIGPGLGSVPVSMKGEFVSDDVVRVTINIVMEKLNQTIEVYYGYSYAYIYVTTAKWQTFYAPFDATLPDGVVAYKCDGLLANNSTLALMKLDDLNVPAYTPVLLYGESVETEDDEIIEEYVEETQPESSVTSGLLRGVLEPTAAPIGSYVLQNQDGTVAFYKVFDGDEYAKPEVPANRCYLTAPASSEAGVKAISFPSDPTAIEAVKDLLSGKSEIYDLEGRRLPALQKGINIVNGKKVMVK